MNESFNDQLNNVYRERNAVVIALLSGMVGDWHIPVCVHTDEDNEGFAIVYAQLPEVGQVSWHIPVDELGPFKHEIEEGVLHWDGHDTKTKYERLDRWANLNVLGYAPKD